MSLLQDYTLDVTRRFENAFGESATGRGGGDSESLDQPLVEKPMAGRGFHEFDQTLVQRAKEMCENDKGRNVSRQVDRTKGIILENIDKVLQRNTSIEVIVRETEQLSDASATFKDGSRGLKRKMIWDNIKAKVAIGLCVVVFLLILLMWICNPNFSKC